MNLREQIQEGQHRANQIIKQVQSVCNDLDKNQIALFTFKEELESQLQFLFDNSPKQTIT